MQLKKVYLLFKCMQVGIVRTNNFIKNTANTVVSAPIKKSACYVLPALAIDTAALSGIYLAKKSFEDKTNSIISELKVPIIHTKNNDKHHRISVEGCILPVGTNVSTNKGIFKVKAGDFILVDKSKNKLKSFSDILKTYKSDSLNPISKEVFELIKYYDSQKDILSFKEKVNLHNDIANEFSRINREIKFCELAQKESGLKTLKQEYELSSKMVNDLEEKYFSRIDVTDFDKAIEKSREILTEIISDKTLNPREKQVAINSIMVRLLPKTNAHQHLKGSIPKEVTLELANKKGYSQKEIDAIHEYYAKGKFGYDSLNDFTQSYGQIGSAINTVSDYHAAIKGIVANALKQGQLTCEIRCATDSLKSDDGKKLSVQEGSEAIISLMDNVISEYKSKGITPPKMGFVFLGYRGKDWDKSISSAVEQAKQAVNVAMKYPDKKFGFDIAGPEDTGYGPKAFKDAVAIIKQYNEKIEKGIIKGEKIGLTMHAGETPTYDNGKPGYMSVDDALEMGVDRIGHGVQAVFNNETMKKIKASGATVEICGVCNVQSIPINTKGMAKHPIQEFINYDIPVTICTDNDAICSTNITKEYMQFLLTGHSNVMNWNKVKDCAKNGIKTAFISEQDKKSAFKVLEERVDRIQQMVNEFEIKD